MTATQVEFGAYNEVGERQFSLHPGQSRVLASRRRFTVACAGTGGGKTVIGPLWMAAQVKRLLDADPGHYVRGMVVAPTFPIMGRATAPTLVEMFKGTDLEGEWVGNQYRWPFGILWLVSGDDPDSLEGGQVDFAWVDEGGQMTFKSWLSLCQRTGVNQAPILVTTTPYMLNWLKSEALARYLAGDKDYCFVQWRSRDNPAFPVEEYERARGSMAPARFSMRYDGVFAAPEGLVYPDFESCLCPPMMELPSGAWVGGLDWGFKEPFVALFAVRYVDDDGRDMLYVHGETYRRRAALSQVQDSLPRGVTWYYDPSRPDSAKELRLAGLTCRASCNAVMEGVDAVTARIYGRRLLVSTACAALRAEAGEYAYPEDRVGERPVGVADHAMDALRYLVMGCDRRRRAGDGQAR